MEYNSKYTGTDIESMLDSVNAKSIYSGGTGITITNGVISAEGGSSVDAYTKAESDAKYALKSDVPYKFVKLSQSEYDALDPKDVNTIYIIE